MVLVTLIESVYNFLWGDLLTLPLGGVKLNLSLVSVHLLAVFLNNILIVRAHLL